MISYVIGRFAVVSIGQLLVFEYLRYTSSIIIIYDFLDSIQVSYMIF